MIKFVNAKLNIGLFITSRRPDGYHNLETLFFPVGLHNGEPCNPSPFCDILEIDLHPDTDRLEDEFIFKGRIIDCEPEKNLVVRAVRSFRRQLQEETGRELLPYLLILEKHLPDGAGLGGGSADAAFTLELLNEISGNPFSLEKLSRMALSLGADCPFFILNRPAFGGGVGEELDPLEVDLDGWWCLIVKPPVYVSTKEAFSGVTPKPAPFNLRDLAELPVEEWRGKVHNDFEDSIFPLHPLLSQIKERLYAAGAIYASMSGSGSSLYGLFRDKEIADEAAKCFDCDTYLCLLGK